jgi:Ca2+-binding RTX toxin-like protein
MPNVSVTGGVNAKGVFLAYTGRDNAFRVARNLALQVNQRYGSTTATYYNPASPPTSPGSGLLIDTVSSVSIDARGYGAVIDDSSGSSVLGGSGPGGKQIVLASDGGLNFRAAVGSETVVAGGGGNLIYFQPGDTGNNVAYTESGSNTIYGGDGNTTISAGSGSNTIFTRGGSSDVFVSGTDHITLGSGAVTVSVLAGGSAYVNGAGAVTVPASLYSLTFTGDTTPGALGSTVYGGMGRVSIQGGAGGGLFRGGAEGDNSIYGGSGTVTVEGVGPGDTLIGGTGANDFIRAGFGNETLTGGGSKVTFGVYDERPGQIAGSTDTISDFKSGDIIRLIGSGLEPTAYKHALQTYNVVYTGPDKGASFQLLDGTTVFLAGYTGSLNHSNLK